jgi:hypothetical protein
LWKVPRRAKACRQPIDQIIRRGLKARPLTGPLHKFGSNGFTRPVSSTGSMSPPVARAGRNHHQSGALSLPASRHRAHSGRRLIPIDAAGLRAAVWNPLNAASNSSGCLPSASACRSSGFVNLRSTAARLRTTPAWTATRFISQMAYSDWRVILAEFGACQTRSSPLERCASRAPQASSCSAATIAALIP